MRFTLILFLFTIISVRLSAQSAITGNIYDDKDRSLLLEGVTVRNLSTKGLTLTDKDGHFALSASKGDLISFALMGYETDTVYLVNLFPRNVYLRPGAQTLRPVNIMGAKISPYLDVRDPAATPARQFDYSKERGGLRLNLGYGKYRRMQQKEQELEEADHYNEEISRNFTPEMVKKLLRIDGEDLKNFMQMYRPTVSMVQAERPFNYEYYTATSYRAWQALPPEQRKLPSLKQVIK